MDSRFDYRFTTFVGADEVAAIAGTGMAEPDAVAEITNGIGEHLVRLDPTLVGVDRFVGPRTDGEPGQSPYWRIVFEGTVAVDCDGADGAQARAVAERYVEDNSFAGAAHGWEFGFATLRDVEPVNMLVAEVPTSPFV